MSNNSPASTEDAELKEKLYEFAKANNYEYLQIITALNGIAALKTSKEPKHGTKREYEGLLESHVDEMTDEDEDEKTEKQEIKKIKVQKYILEPCTIPPIDIVVKYDIKDAYTQSRCMQRFWEGSSKRSFHICCGVKGIGKTTFFRNNAPNISLTYVPIDFEQFKLRDSDDRIYPEYLLEDIIRTNGFSLLEKKKKITTSEARTQNSQQAFSELGEELVYHFKRNQNIPDTKFLLHFDNLQVLVSCSLHICQYSRYFVRITHSQEEV